MQGDKDPVTVKRLSISAGRMGTTALISVEDTGPGLPEKARENLFSAFRGSARAGGTGLGLAIAQELVRAHGGSLELRDSRSVGTQFEIRLPDAPVSLDSRARAPRQADGVKPLSAGAEPLDRNDAAMLRKVSVCARNRLKSVSQRTRKPPRRECRRVAAHHFAVGRP